MELKQGYKQTEVGVIPNEWKLVSLIHLAEGKKELFDDGDWVEAEHVTDEGIRLIQTGNIGEGKFIEKDDKKYIYPKSFELLKCKELRKGDLLICRLAEPAGRACVFPNIGEDKVITSVDVTIFRPRPEVANREYLNQLFTTRNWFNAVSENCGGTTHKRISRGALGKLLIPLPELTEQTAIATALSDMDNLIAGQEKLIAKKKAIKQGTMQRLLRPKDRWEVKRLGDLGECIIGLTYSPDNVKDNGLLVLRSSNIEGASLKYDDNVYVDLSVPEKLILRENDILICVRNGSRNLIGKSALIKGRAVGETFGAFMSVFRSPFNKYIFNCFQSDIIKRQIDEHLGATINQITNKSLNSFEIPFPPPEEQAEIAKLLSDLEHEIVLFETTLEKYKLLKQGMMQELLTGKTRLI